MKEIEILVQVYDSEEKVENILSKFKYINIKKVIEMLLNKNKINIKE